MGEVWDRAVGSQPPPERPVVLAMALGAAVLVMAPGLWPVARGVVTIAHEGAHAVAAVLSGRRLSGIRLHSDTSGLTLSRGRPRGPGMFVTAIAGYLGPAALGLTFAALLDHDHAVGVLWLALVLLAVMLLFIRNLYGLWSVLVVGCGVFAVSWWASPAAQSSFAYLLTWFLLGAAPRTVVELQGSRRRSRERNSDADVLARLTGVPALLWVAFYLVTTLGALALGTRLLL